MVQQCPLCFSGEFSPVYDNKTSVLPRIVRCSACSHFFTINIDPDSIASLYTEGAYQVVDNRRNFWDIILTWEYSRIIKKIIFFSKKKGRLLDFGSGKGKFAILAVKKGWNVKCVETAEARARFAREKYGLDVDTRHYTGGRLADESFDALSLLHVLEHLPHPTQLLNDLVEYNLTKEAIIVIEVPNLNSWQSRIAGSKWMHLDLPRHLQHFTSHSLDNIAETTRLSIIKREYFSTHLGVLGMTDSILKLAGYRGNIIYDIKAGRKGLLLICAGILLPLAFLLELVAAAANRGGIVRIFLSRKT